MKPNPLLELSFSFSVLIVDFCHEIQSNEKEYTLSQQLIRSGTSIGSNIEESQGAISKPDFINKLHISLKEAKESTYWLRIMKEIKKLKHLSLIIEKLLLKCNELIHLLVAILKTTKQNMEKKKNGI